MRQICRSAALAPLAFLVCCGVLGCDKSQPGIALTKTDDAEPVPDVPVPAANGPMLGSVVHATPVRRLPKRDAAVIGYLHAGAKVARADEPYSTQGCEGGWYPVRPRGFVCLEEGATLDPAHPTLLTMAIQPNRDHALPYAYAETLEDAPLYEVDEQRDRGVKPSGSTPSRSGMAVVGSWNATDPEGKPLRLAMLTNGRFIEADKLRQAQASTFHGIELNAEVALPVGFIVKRGVSLWKETGPLLEKGRALEYHERLQLSGKSRSVGGEKYWEILEGHWVRHRDVTTVHKRDELPAFVTDTKKWVDISVVTGTAVLYEGQTPVYATLVSVGKDRLGEDIENPVITERGEFEVVAKHITALNAKVGSFANRVDIYDTPWTLELASGQLMHGAYWHSRFGIEHGPGNVQLSPADAQWLWGWIGPEVPEGWHAVTELPTDSERAVINVRK